MSYVNFMSQIKTALGGISDLKAVYDYPETQPTGFPFCIVTESSGADTYLDTTKNDTTYAFEIAAIMDLEDGVNSAYQKIRSVADDIISTIQGTSFTGGGYFHVLRSFQFTVEERGSGKVIVFSAILEVRKANTV